MSTSTPEKRPAARGSAAKGYHHGNLRAALIEAGLSAIAQDERAELSLRDLARRAGVSPSAAYRHFADKEALLAAIAAEGFRRLSTAGADAARASADANQRLSAYGRGYVDFAVNNPALFHLMFGGRVARGAGDELAHESGASFRRLLEGVAASMSLPASDPRVTVGAASAWALAHGLASLVIDDQLRRFDVPIDTLVDAVLFGVDQ